MATNEAREAFATGPEKHSPDEVDEPLRPLKEPDQVAVEVETVALPPGWLEKQLAEARAIPPEEEKPLKFKFAADFEETPFGCYFIGTATNGSNRVYAWKFRDAEWDWSYSSREAAICAAQRNFEERLARCYG